MEFPRRGEIWLVSLEPTIGSEIGKTRPALVISNDRNNQFADTVTVIPITSKTERIYPFETFLSHQETRLPRDSKAKSNQIRTIDKRRLIKLLAKLSSEKLTEVEQAILIHLGIE
jgi:mRNA interferase MazF